MCMNGTVVVVGVAVLFIYVVCCFVSCVSARFVLMSACLVRFVFCMRACVCLSVDLVFADVLRVIDHKHARTHARAYGERERASSFSVAVTSRPVFQFFIF